MLGKRIENPCLELKLLGNKALSSFYTFYTHFTHCVYTFKFLHIAAQDFVPQSDNFGLIKGKIH